jgi:hypothetical protein
MKIIMSAQNKHASSLLNRTHTQHLAAWLTKAGFTYVECEGCYQGEKEVSFIVTFEYGTQFSQLLKEADFLQQESVLIMHDDLTACRLHYVVDGSQQSIGDFNEVSPEVAKEFGSYTLINNTYYVCMGGLNMYALLLKNIKSLSVRFQYINHGGCGLVAKYLYEALQAEGIHVNLKVSLGYNLSESQDPNMLVGEAQNNKLSAHKLPNHHIFLELPNGLLIDGTGVLKCFYTPHATPLTYDNLEYMLDLPIWNGRFISRNTNISELELTIKQLVSSSFPKSATVVY